MTDLDTVDSVSQIQKQKQSLTTKKEKEQIMRKKKKKEEKVTKREFTPRDIIKEEEEREKKMKNENQRKEWKYDRTVVNKITMCCGEVENWKLGGLIFILRFTITPFMKTLFNTSIVSSLLVPLSFFLS
jgi:hypothetical protein